MASVDLKPVDPSMIPVFGKIPTRSERGEWAPMKVRRVIYQQRSHDYAPIIEDEVTDEENAIFAKYGIFGMKAFLSDFRSDEFDGLDKIRYFYYPKEPSYVVRRADRPLGLTRMAFEIQLNLIAADIFFPREFLYPHPILVDRWEAKFGFEEGLGRLFFIQEE